MTLREHTEKLSMPFETFLIFMHAVGAHPVYSVIERRGKVYQLWADKQSHRKIISCAELERMTLVQFVHWLKERYPYAKVLFPDPTVYQQ